jgi:hypothetical protein
MVRAAGAKRPGTCIDQPFARRTRTGWLPVQMRRLVRSARTRGKYLSFPLTW